MHVKSFFMLLSSADFFQNKLFIKKSFRNTVRLSKGLDPDQDQRDLDPNHLQCLAADDKSFYYQGKSKRTFSTDR